MPSLPLTPLSFARGPWPGTLRAGVALLAAVSLDAEDALLAGFGHHRTLSSPFLHRAGREADHALVGPAFITQRLMVSDFARHRR